jgi:hypothetical protein
LKILNFSFFRSFQFFHVLPTRKRKLKPEVRLFMSFEDRPFFIFQAIPVSSRRLPPQPQPQPPPPPFNLPLLPIAIASSQCRSHLPSL